MARITFRSYSILTIIVTSVVIYHAHQKYEQFYPTGLYLATAKHALLTIANMAIVMAYLIGKLFISVFLERVHEREMDLLNDRLKSSITDTLLSLTIFREHFNAQFVSLLLLLLFFQIFHWLAKYRVEYLEHSPYDLKKNIKLFTLLSILLLFDIIFLFFSISRLIDKGPDAMMLFSLEFALLLITGISTLISFFINIEGIKREGRWDNKGLYILYLEFFSEGICMILYSIFFVVSLWKFGLPIHIIRQLFISFRTFYRRFQDIIQYQTIMNEKFQDATDAELENSDKICIVCREDMTTGKKLSCGHILHLHCLRSWLERQQTCPICRALVIVDDPNRPQSLLVRLFRRRPPAQFPPPAPAAAAAAAQPQQPPAPVPVVQPQQQQPQQHQQPHGHVHGMNFHQINDFNRFMDNQRPRIVFRRVPQQQQQVQQQQVQPQQNQPDVTVQQQPQQVLQQQQQEPIAVGEQHQAQIPLPIPPPIQLNDMNAFGNNNNNNSNNSNNNNNNVYNPLLHIMSMQNHIFYLNQQLEILKRNLGTMEFHQETNVNDENQQRGAQSPQPQEQQQDQSNVNINDQKEETENKTIVAEEENKVGKEQEEEVKDKATTTTTTTTTSDEACFNEPTIETMNSDNVDYYDDEKDKKVDTDDFSEQLRRRVSKHKNENKE